MSPNDSNQTNLSSQELELLMMDHMAGRLSAKDAQAFDAQLAADPVLSQEYLELQQMMRLLDQHNQLDVPESSEQMDQNFYAMLHEAVKQETQKQTTWWQRLTSMIQWSQVKKLGYAFSFLAVGFMGGHYLHLLDNQSSLEAERLAIKDQQIQALTVLSLLDMPSANKRLMAVSLAGMSEQPNQAIVDALLTTLKQDNNTNVRLEALQVLAKHADQEPVRAGLVAAINQQHSPMVQVALANLMLNLNETRAIAPLRELLEQNDLIEPVRTELNNTVNELI